MEDIANILKVTKITPKKKLRSIQLMPSSVRHIIVYWKR